MPWIKYYEKERRRFSREYSIKLNDDEIKHVFELLKNHYHIPHELTISGRKGYGRCTHRRIRVAHESSIGMLAHEVAHAIQMKQKRPSERWHTQRHATIMKRVCRHITNHIDWKKTSARRDPEIQQASDSKLALCPSCGEAIDMRQDVRFCCYCGFRLEDML
jgi:NADH pyrophosphatase NudC (nudix superfamily)